MYEPRIPVNKIAPLILREFVKRQRLFDCFEIAGKGKAFWISGPGGSGKSTLVAGYLQEKEAPSLLYHVDALDGDPATCFLYLGEAVQCLANGSGINLPLLTPEYLPSIDIFLIQYFAQLYQAVPPGTWLVFDNVQEAPAESFFTKILVAAIGQLPRSCNLAIISRQEPSPEMSRYQANRTMQHIGWNDLSFTFSEFEELLQRENLPDPANQAKTLHELTNGWIAGAVLWILHEKNFSSRNEMTFRETPEILFSYFAGEVIEKSDKDIRNFLLTTSQLPFMTTDLVTDLTDAVEPYLLERIRQMNFFVEKRQSHCSIYQYHPLFHTYLKKTAERIYAKDRLNDLRLRSARTLENHGLHEEAAELYASIGAFDDLTRIVLRRAKNLIAEGRYRTLAAWLEMFPDSVLGNNPHLLYWRGVSCMLVQPLDGRMLCSRAYDMFVAGDDYLGQIVSWSTVVEWFIMMRTGFDELDHWIAEGERLGGKFSEIGDPESAGQFAASMLVALLLRNHGHPDLPLWQGRCEKLLDHCRNMQVMAFLVSSLFWSYHYLGEVRKAGFLEVRLQLVLSQASIPVIGRIVALTMLALAAVGRGEHRSCLELVEKTLETADKVGIHSYDLIVIAFGAYTGLSTGDLPLAKRYLEKMEPLVVPHALWDYAQYHFLRAWYYTEKMDLVRAQSALVTAEDLIEACGNPYTKACVKVLRANLLLDQGDPLTASKELEAILENERLRYNKTMHLVACLTLADCAFALQRREDAVRYVHNALEIIRVNGLTMPFPLINRRIGPMFARALDAEVDHEVIHDMIRRWRLRAPSPEETGERWPWPVKIYTFGGLSIFENGKKLEPSTKPPRKLFEVLVLLIAAKRNGILKETAADRLWPDSDGDKAMQSLKTTLHRLRRLFRDENVILLENGRLLLNHRICWVDSWHFEWLEQQSAAVDEEKSGRYLLQGLRLYKDEFLPEYQDSALAANYAVALHGRWADMLSKARDATGGENCGVLTEEARRALADAKSLAHRYLAD